MEKTRLTPPEVRDQLDEILAKEITALLDVDSRAAMMSFNLASISCITLIIEREREIKHYTEFPPERYSKESFLNELVDIGLEKDELLESTIESVIKGGYISVADNGDLQAEMPAFMMVGFLDNMFPGMQGMNLVAFVLQMNDEVNSGRKTMELAINSFESTLKSRGVSVSKDRAEKKATEMVTGKVATSSQSKEVSRKLKKNNVGRLSKLIKKRRKRSIDSPGQLKVKDVFDKGPTKEEIQAQKEDIYRAEEAAELAKELALKDEKIAQAQEAAKEAERQLKEIEEREKQLEAAQQEALKAKEMASELDEREAQMAEKEAQLKALEEKLKQEEDLKQKQDEENRQKQIEDEEKKKASQDDDDIESQIAAFESELTMPCPLCKDGEIISKTTEKGKEFFSCSKAECRFVSWDKPYHFECPLCKNTFLTEMVAPNGEKGLKCPRAACSYTQNNLYDPKQNMTKAAASSGKPKKKKKIVRRRKRR